MDRIYLTPGMLDALNEIRRRYEPEHGTDFSLRLEIAKGGLWGVDVTAYGRTLGEYGVDLNGRIYRWVPNGSRFDAVPEDVPA